MAKNSEKGKKKKTSVKREIKKVAPKVVKKTAPFAKPKPAGFQPEIAVCPSSQSLFEEAAHLFLETALEAVGKRGRFAAALSGGNTPKGFFQQISEEPYRSLVPWDKTHVFWVDEREVPLTHKDSNYRLAQEILLSKVPVPKEQIFPMTDGRKPAQEAAHLYERGLKRFFGAGEAPRFDFVLLGMGEDGHTASLFPGVPQLNELDKTVVGYFVDEARKERISLTFPVLNAARLAVVMVEGEKKARRLRDVLEGASTPPLFPVQYLRLVDGRLLFMLDSTAASLLKSASR